MNVLSEEYLKWINEETSKKTLYYPNIEENDNLESIVTLYNRLKKYQDEFYIIYKNETDSIIFSYNNENYEISCMYGPEILYCIKKTTKKAKFDIEDVKENKTNNNELSNRLIIMKTVIADLMAMGVDERTINKQTNIYSRTLKKPIK